MATTEMDNVMVDVSSSTSHLAGAGFTIDVLGVIAGIIAFVIIVNSLRKVGGQVGSAFTLTLLGVVAQTLALLESVLVTHLELLPEPNFMGLIKGHEIHDTLMVIGMIFFVLGAKKFSDLSR